MALTKAGKAQILSAYFGSGATPASLKIVLFNTMPDVDSGDYGSGGVQPSGGSYAPVSLTNNSTNFPPLTNTNEMVTGVDVDFGSATADWGSIVGAGLTDSSNNLIDATAFSVPRTVLNGDPVKFPAGSIKFILTNA